MQKFEDSSPRRGPWYAAAAAALLGALVACGGGGSDSGTAYLRVVNVTNDVASLDLYGDREDAGNSLRVGATASDTASSFAALTSGTYDLELRRQGSDAVLMSQTSRGLGGDARYSLVGYGYEGAYRSALLLEDQSAPSDGRVKLRVFNGAPDAGSLDVYLTASDTLLVNASANFASVAGANVSGFAEPSSGSYRLRVTAAGDKDDVRLDVANIDLANRSAATLLITPGSGGVLVNAYLLVESGSMTLAKNTAARVRVVASVAQSGSLDASSGSTTLASALRSPSVGAYRLVDAASASLSLSVNGSSVGSPAFTARAGADYTVLVAGEAGAVSTAVLTDNNRRPATTGRAKIRLVNALTDATGGLTLSANYDAVASDIRTLSSSTPTQLIGDTDYRLEVTSPASSTPLYSATEVNLVSTGVYTVFMLGGQSSPTGALRRER